MFLTTDSLPESVKNITAAEKWSTSQKDFFLTCANLSIESGDSEAVAIEKGLEQARHLQNAVKPPKVYYCRHMEPGIAGYGNQKVFMNADTMKKIMPSFSGKPVFVQHKSLEEAEKLRDRPDGYVVETFYNEMDGWAWSKFLVVSEQGHQAVENGYLVSNAFVGRNFAGPGRHIGIDFDREILDAEFTHLALVTNPRYKNAKVFTPDQFKGYQADKRKQLEQVHNSDDITKGDKKMAIKFFAKKAKEEVTKLEDLNDETVIQLTNGDEISLGDMVKTVEIKKAEEAEAAKKAAEKKDEQIVNEDTEIEVGGEKMTVKALKEKYEAISKEQITNADEAAEKAKKEAEAKKKEEEHLKNSDNFKKLSDANKAKEVVTIKTSFDKVATGKKRYGTSDSK